jgi:hypothetical protein
MTMNALLERGYTSPRKSTSDAVSRELKRVTKITASACSRNCLVDHRQHKVRDRNGA